MVCCTTSQQPWYVTGLSAKCAINHGPLLGSARVRGSCPKRASKAPQCSRPTGETYAPSTPSYRLEYSHTTIRPALPVCFHGRMSSSVAHRHQLLFLAPMPIILLIFIKADSVLWYYSGFAVPSIAMSAIVLPFWSKQPYGMSCHRVRVIQW